MARQLLMLFLFILTLGTAARAHDALYWFRKATYTTDVNMQIHYYKRALEEDPTFHQARHNLANVYYRKGFVNRSIQLYEEMIRQGRGYYQTFYNLACCYARKGDSQHALKALRRSFEKGFHDRRLLYGDRDLAALRQDPAFIRLASAFLGPRPIPRQRVMLAGAISEE